MTGIEDRALIRVIRPTEMEMVSGICHWEVEEAENTAMLSGRGVKAGDGGGGFEMNKKGAGEGRTKYNEWYLAEGKGLNGQYV
jgi:hypothetical protein